jgi:Replication-relaxation
MLTDRDEQILQAVNRYRFMAALDVCHLLYAPSSLTYVRERLSTLAGGKDGATNAVLYRFTMPKARTGNLERIYAVGAKGRELLAQDNPAWGYFRPYKFDNLKYSFVLHRLGITRFLVACQYLARQQDNIRILDVPDRELSVQMRQNPLAIPDGFVCFGIGTEKLPVLLEVDCGTEGQQQFKKGVAARIEYIRSGQYEQLFGIAAANVCYAVITEESQQSRASRRETLKRWTLEVLEEQNRKSWGRVFWFADSQLKSVYSLDLLQKPVWHTGDRSEAMYLLRD